MSQFSTTASRYKVNSKPKDSPKPTTESVIASQKPIRAKSVTPDDKRDSRAKKSLITTKPKSGELITSAGSLKTRSFLEQFARPRRQRAVLDSSEKRCEQEDESKKELLEKIEKSEALVRNLETEVLNLKVELDKAHRLNLELGSRNSKLVQDLAAAQAKISALNNCDKKSGEDQVPKFKHIRQLIANKLEQSTVKNVVINAPTTVRFPQSTPPPPMPPLPPPRWNSRSSDTETKVSMSPPPPPPLPPMRPLARAAAPPKSPIIVEVYNSLKKHEGKRDGPGPGSQYKLAVASAHSSIVDEIQNRSAHLLAIKADIETKGDFINSLIQKVLAAAYTDIEDVVKFVDWLDMELSSLADERAVLKHFNWPERKADAMREAAIEYNALKVLERAISSYKDDPEVPCETTLRKMAALLDKSERSIQRFIQLRRSVMRSYQDLKIPVSWMLDSGIVKKIKQASMKLANMYMKRVMTEVELAHNVDRESNQALLLQSVHFAYRTHQFAGGLDSEALCAFEEIRRRVPGRLGGSQELLAAITSS